MKHVRKQFYFTIFFILNCFFTDYAASFQEEQLFTKKYLSEHDPDNLLLFCPDEADIVKKLLIGLITNEKECIRASLFRLTDKDIVYALLYAHKNGTLIELIVDSGAISQEFHGKVLDLNREGIPVYIYYGKHKGFGTHPIMHHKSFLFTTACNGKPLSWSGSLNPTINAISGGSEEYITTRINQNFVTKFSEQFERIKTRSVFYTTQNLKPSIPKGDLMTKTTQTLLGITKKL